MQNNIIDWSEAFDGVGRMLYRKKPGSDTMCIDENDEEVKCVQPIPGWFVGVAIGVFITIVTIILVCVATKKCKKKWKCARIVKCCKKNAGADA